MALSIGVPVTAAELDQVRDLMRAFSDWQRQRNVEDIQLVDQYFDAAGFEAELGSLPGKYGPPHGQLLLATLDGAAAGCVALGQIEAQSLYADLGFCSIKPYYELSPQVRNWLVFMELELASPAG